MIGSSSLLNQKVAEPRNTPAKLNTFYKIIFVVFLVTETIIPSHVPPKHPKGCHALNMTQLGIGRG